MAGIYVYQQIIKTPTEWESNESIYPSGVFLFEDLGDGKFNIALGDGVHRFVDLPKAFMNALVTVKTSTDMEYVLTITSPEGSFDTPNLKGKEYTHPKFTPRDAGLYKITVNDEGHVSEATEVTKEDITGLGIPAQDTTYEVATPSSAGLMSSEDKIKLDNSIRLTDVNSVTTLASLPVDKYSIKATVAKATTMSFSDTPTEGMEYMIDVLNSSSADIDQPIPNGDGWQCDVDSVALVAGAVTPISVRYVHGIYCVIVKQ